MQDEPLASSLANPGQVFACNEIFYLKVADKRRAKIPCRISRIPGTTFLSPVTKFFVKQTFTRFQEKTLLGQALQGRSGLDNVR
jgi:hypothetical protein